MSEMRARKITVYATAWVVYMLFAFFAFPIFNITVMLVSIALVMLGAWLYGLAGSILTIAITIPYHYFMLTYQCDDPHMRSQAFNPFGITTQFLVSASVVLLRNTKLKLEALNITLERKVRERTDELERLQHHIVKNNDSAQVLLSHMLLGDIGASLSAMLKECKILSHHLATASNPSSVHAVKLAEMIEDSIRTIQNLEFVDHFFTNKTTGFSRSVREISEHFQKTSGTNFVLDFDMDPLHFPVYMQHQLYRITQEAITNAVRHAHAKHIHIHIGFEADSYSLRVINDGLPMPDNTERGLGMQLMQHRTEQLGGRLEWNRISDGRTEVSCRIPKALE